jgi:hypothetical protein
MSERHPIFLQISKLKNEKPKQSPLSQANLTLKGTPQETREPASCHCAVLGGTEGKWDHVTSQNHHHRPLSISICFGVVNKIAVVKKGFNRIIIRQPQNFETLSHIFDGVIRQNNLSVRYMEPYPYIVAGYN